MALARERACALRSQIEQGRGPQFEKHKVLAIPSFREAADKVYDLHSKCWRNGKHHAQWKRTLEMCVYPFIGKMTAQSHGLSLTPRKGSLLRCGIGSAKRPITLATSRVVPNVLKTDTEKLTTPSKCNFILSVAIDRLAAN